MKIKQLKIKGFKSFANETTLNFNEGFTAIVGPNGSGKSNLIEAIRWVMGEQSAKSLRGSRMHDVIFSGTKNRASVNQAQVELLFDNSDRFLPFEFDEVSIMRRISRAGDSIYRINQKDCRLKDIVNLFVDSGLGKESFSVISQGQVEAIFNAKPEERRAIFEEVAGVFKYKTQKVTAERKLEKTQENLNRVQDILYELEKQLEPLEKQAKTAETYLVKKKQLTTLDIAVTAHQIGQLTAQQTANTKEQATLKSQAAKWQKEKETLKADLETVKAQLEQTDQSDKINNEKLLALTQQLERNEAALELIAEKKKNQEIYRQEKQLALKQLKAQAADTHKQLQAKQEALEQVNDELSEIAEKRDDLRQSKQQLNEDPEILLEEMRENYIADLQSLTQLSNRKEYITQEIKKNSAKMKRLASQQDTSKKARTETKEQLAALEKDVATIKDQIAEKLAKHQDIAQKITKKEHQLKNYKARLSTNQNDYHRAQAEFQALQAMEKNYTGYYAGVRAVMKRQDQMQGIVGTVAELIKIPNDYLLAIDTALASTSQFIVTQDEKSAQAAISYLKQTKQGRATFLPLNVIKSRQISSQYKKQLKNMAGFVGIASELVTFDQNIRHIIENLLGQTIIAESLDQAVAIARTIKHRHKVITLSGDVINPGGAMTGGAHRQNNAQPIFMQKEKSRQLELTMQETQKTAEVIQEKLTQLEKEWNQLAQAKDKIVEEGASLRQNEQQKLAKIDTLKMKQDQEKRTCAGLDFEWSEAQTANKELIAEQEEVTVKSEKLKKQVDQMNHRIQKLQSQQKNLSAEKEKVNEKLYQIENEYHTVNERAAIFKTEIKQYQHTLKKVATEQEELQKAMDQQDEVLKTYSKTKLLNQKEKFAAEHVQIKQDLQKAHEQQAEAHKQEEKLAKDLSIIEEKLAKCSRQKNKLEIDHSKRDVKLDYLLNYLVEEYQTSYEDTAFNQKEMVDLEKAKKEVKQLKDQIKALGSVNLAAIEEYEAIAERYDFLATQQKDLIAAKQQLFDTMNGMDHEVKHRFQDTFEQIKKEFALVFPEMFGGGQAQLELTEPNNLLETGIEIVAQPPGKKLTRLSLLSGGERALTAISLLFAIIKVRPIPFCILDEVESSLDEANVYRFSNYLKQFEKDTQFIVITHRKGTMESADRLYGVTMQEQGVSKLVSVSLTEAERMDHVV